METNKDKKINQMGINKNKLLNNKSKVKMRRINIRRWAKKNKNKNKTDDD